MLDITPQTKAWKAIRMISNETNRATVHTWVRTVAANPAMPENVCQTIVDAYKMDDFEEMYVTLEGITQDTPIDATNFLKAVGEFLIATNLPHKNA